MLPKKFSFRGITNIRVVFWKVPVFLCFQGFRLCCCSDWRLGKILAFPGFLAHFSSLPAQFFQDFRLRWLKLGKKLAFSQFFAHFSSLPAQFLSGLQASLARIWAKHRHFRSFLPTSKILTVPSSFPVLTLRNALLLSFQRLDNPPVQSHLLYLKLHE